MEEAEAVEPEMLQWAATELAAQPEQAVMQAEVSLEQELPVIQPVTRERNLAEQAVEPKQEQGLLPGQAELAEQEE